MKLRNKKTGELVEVFNIGLVWNKYGMPADIGHYKNLAELNEEWEDYEDKDALSNEPLIKDEKIRKIVRALFDVWVVEDVKIDSNKYFLVTTIEAIGKGWKLEIPNININGVFKPTELCGEEE